MGSTYQSQSRHAINRLAALHLVCGVLDAFAAPVYMALDEQDRGQASVLASRIAMSVARAKKMDGDDTASRRLVNTIMRRNDVMTDKLGAEVDARAAMAMVVDIVAEAEEAIPRKQKFLDMRIEWGNLHTLLAEFQEVLDKDLTAAAEIDSGCRVSEAMRLA